MQPLNRLQIAWRRRAGHRRWHARQSGHGYACAVVDYLRPEADIFIQSENGVIGAGPLASPDRADTDLVDASSRRVTLRPGAAIVDSSWSFAMIRGGHIDVAVLGAFEVAANGDLANWDMRLPNKGPLVGGAMDLAACARAVWVIMEHVTRKGAPRLLERVYVAAHRHALRQARVYGSCRHRNHARWYVGAGDAGRPRRDGFAEANRCTSELCARLPAVVTPPIELPIGTPRELYRGQRHRTPL